MMTVQSQADLFQVVGAVGPGSGFTHLLHGRHQKTDENRDDGHDDEQFNERERCPHTGNRTLHGWTPE